MPSVAFVPPGCERTAHLKASFGSGWAMPTEAWWMFTQNQARIQISVVMAKASNLTRYRIEFSGISIRMRAG